MFSNKMVSLISKVSEGKIRKSELKDIKRKTIKSNSSTTKLTIENGVVTLNKTHKPNVVTLHSKENLYRTVKAVWNLVDALDVKLEENDVKLHVDKYVNAVRSEDEVTAFVERLDIAKETAYHKALKKDVKVKSVLIGAKVSGSTIIPFIECEYIAELEVSAHED